MDWFVAVSEEADSLEQNWQSYTRLQEHAFRYLYDGHILYYNMLRAGKREEFSRYFKNKKLFQLKNVNINALNPEIASEILSSGPGR